eukprot:TRINITY_DN10546_c0_g7_i2.p1 TRINITY_DN10546_c0_g7~~TRINITY_DN10546_c0_g7_i2.p1  ORF type:complete len:179 (+),score=66.96 TRINITY_DN10546_c0_g7_i2:85-621(+)
MYHMFRVAWNNGCFWHSLFVTALLCLLPPAVQLVLSQLLDPSPTQRVARYEASVWRSLRARKYQVAPEPEGGGAFPSESQMAAELDRLARANAAPESDPSYAAMSPSALIVDDEQGAVRQEFLGFAFAQEMGASPEVDLCATPNPTRRSFYHRSAAMSAAIIPRKPSAMPESILIQSD